jgi:hypothetical protein
MTAALLALAILAQDDVNVLIQQLGDDSIEVRESATVKLTKIGEPARAALRKASESPSGEVRARATMILKSLDFQKELQAWLGPPSRITLSGEFTLEEAIKEFERQTGQKISCPAWPEGRFTVDLKDTDAWSALNALCRASGTRTFQLGANGPALSGRRFVEPPTAISGAFCIRFNGSALYRSYQVDSGHESRTFSLAIDVGWERAVVPTNVALELDRMEDDLGNDLAPAIHRYARRQFSGNPLVVSNAIPEFRRILTLSTDEQPDPKASRITMLKGKVLLWIRASAEDLDLPVPAPGETSRIDVRICDSQLKESSEMPVVLSGATRSGAILSCRLEFKNSDERLLKNTYQLWHLNDKKGRRYVGTVRMLPIPGSGETGYGIEFGNLPADAEPASVTVRIPRRIVALEIPFVLKDIPLK